MFLAVSDWFNYGEVEAILMVPISKPDSSGPSAEAPKSQVADSARELYRQFFDTVVVADDDQPLQTEAYRLRYQVYCVENPFEDPADKPDGLERDTYDDRSMHCLLRHRRSSVWAGTVRLVLPDRTVPSHSFAMQQHCEDPLLSDPERFPVLEMAEVSRFCISKEFRKRQNDWLYPQSNEPDEAQDERRVIPNMTLGLIEGLIDMSVRRKVAYWCAVMEPGLLRILARLGIHFQNIGPLVSYHGRRQPCFIELRSMLRRVHEDRPDVWEILTDGGRHWNRLVATQGA